MTLLPWLLLMLEWPLVLQMLLWLHPCQPHASLLQVTLVATCACVHALL